MSGRGSRFQLHNPIQVALRRVPQTLPSGKGITGTASTAAESSQRAAAAFSRGSSQPEGRSADARESEPISGARAREGARATYTVLHHHLASTGRPTPRRVHLHLSRRTPTPPLPRAPTKGPLSPFPPTPPLLSIPLTSTVLNLR